MNDNWIEIVETLQPYVKCNSTELKFQQEIENCLKFLGWRNSNKTMQPQVTINIGHKNSIRPDIVLYKNGIPVLPIEIKRPSNICNIKQESQLMSYMRQLRLNIGLYIGENIQLYYDNPNDFENPISVFKVEFREDDANGDIFCEMLSYGKFDITSLEDFCKERYNQIIARNNLQQRLNEFFFSSNVTKNIISLIKEKFLKEGFEEKALENELAKLTCKIEWKQPYCIAPPKAKIPKSESTNETEFSLDDNKYWRVGRFVLAVVKQYVSEHPDITLEELENVFPSNLNGSRNMGVVRTVNFLNERPKWKHHYFMKEDEKILLKNNTTIVVNREWGNTGKSRPYFQRFLEHIRTFYQVYSR